MSRSNGPLSQVRGAIPPHWPQPSESDPQAQQGYAPAPVSPTHPTQPRYPQQGFGNVQGQPQQSYAPQAPAYPQYAQAPQPPADPGHYAAAQYAPAQSQPSYQPVFDRYAAPQADAGQRSAYEPHHHPAPARPQPPQQQAYAPQQPSQQPSLYDTHAQPRGSVYDQWPQAPTQPAQSQPQAPSARGYDFSAYAPSAAPAPAYDPHSGHQAHQARVGQQPAPYSEPPHDEPQWHPSAPTDRRDEYAAPAGNYAAQAGYDQQGYPNDGGGQLQNTTDQAYDPDDVPDYEEDEPRRGHRGLVMVSALVGAIALGGGLAFAYKKFIKPPTEGAQVAKVQAPKGPAKTQPADPGGKQFSNLDSKLQNRLGDGSGAPAAPIATAPPAASTDADGVKRVQTYQIGRDGSVGAPPPVPGMVVVQPAAPPQPVQAAMQPAAMQPIAAPPVPPPQALPTPQPRVAAITPQPRVPTPVNAAPPEPVAAAPAPVARKPAVKKNATRDDLAATTGAVVPAAAAPAAVAAKTTGGSGYVAVLASKGSKAEAERANADLEQKLDVLKGKPFDVQEANLTAKGKGIVYRSVVGPPGSLAFANSICEQVKAAGHGDCWPVRY